MSPVEHFVLVILYLNNLLIQFLEKKYPAKKYRVVNKLFTFQRSKYENFTIKHFYEEQKPEFFTEC